MHCEDILPLACNGEHIAQLAEALSAASGSRVGGSWGAGSEHAIISFWAFENDDCTGAVKAKIQRNDGEGFEQFVLLE